jgi:hypothetical protein
VDVVVRSHGSRAFQRFSPFSLIADLRIPVLRIGPSIAPWEQLVQHVKWAAESGPLLWVVRPMNA